MRMQAVEFLLAGNGAASLMMTGLIWLVQIVHYPLFDQVGKPQFAEYERRHSQLISFVVGPLMLLELGCSLGLVLLLRRSVPAWIGLALVAVIWASTAALQIPCHNALQAGFDTAAHRRLVRTNWVRTIAWTLRGAIGLLLLIDKS
jgi:hypothetical protein